MSPGPVPTGTYRVQLTAEHGFAALAAQAPHLARLGVSHAYLSPVLTAAPGSQHGYDVVDHGHVDAALGGEDGLRAAAGALRAHGIGIVVDVVPNHTAMTVPEYLNRVVWSVLRDGSASPYASWLDVDWAADPQLLLPVLARRIDECLDAGEILVDRTGGPDGEPVVRWGDHVLPVRPGTEDLPLEQLLDAQAYRLAYWRVADEELNYRRFFDVDALFGLRVEDPDVFAETHAVVLRLVHDGVVDGLRIDHPDGLADPREYLWRLSAAARRDSGAAPWVVVEKILEDHEQLPADWACAGTTGYDALAAIARVQVDPAGVPVLTAAFAELTGTHESWAQVSDRARHDVLRGPIVAEVDRLARVAHDVCQAELRLRDHSLRGLTEGLVELLAAMPVYRAYVVPGEPAPAGAVEALGEAAPSRPSSVRTARPRSCCCATWPSAPVGAARTRTSSACATSRPAVRPSPRASRTRPGTAGSRSWVWPRSAAGRTTPAARSASGTRSPRGGTRPGRLRCRRCRPTTPSAARTCGHGSPR